MKIFFFSKTWRDFPLNTLRIVQFDERLNVKELYVRVSDKIKIIFET